MRDTHRIDPTLRMISALWKLHPDMRLGQLLVNLGGSDLWNLEEDELLKRIGIVLGGKWDDLVNYLNQPHTEGTS